MKIKTVLVAAPLLFLPLAVHAQDAYNGKYTTCVDYYTVGNSSCAPVASTPIIVQMPPSPANPTVSAAPVPPKDAVTQYLDNYGKPPREFVEFYLNPTPENAMKWVATYNQMVQRSQALSHSWTQADTLYQEALAKGVDPATLVSSNLPPVMNFNMPVTEAQATAITQAADLQVKSAVSTAATPTEVHLGAFAASQGQGLSDTPVHLTYYFSETCPYCAKMTPELNSIFNNMDGKLTLTCVDVTPLSATHKPAPENISGKLPCNWRTPDEDEVATNNVQQTPTMLIRRGTGAPVRISGYVPTATLMGYINGQTTAPVAPSADDSTPLL